MASSISWDPWIRSWVLGLLICFPHACSWREHPPASSLQDLSEPLQKFAFPKRIDVNSTLRRKLDAVNRPAFKSIQSSDGDTIDCVALDRQPAFDHPQLKGLKNIEAYPASRPDGSSRNTTFSQSGSIDQVWKQSGRCPKGTIPIRRTSVDDLKRSASVENFGRKSSVRIDRFDRKTVTRDQAWEGGHQHAIAYVSGDQYYGAKATINIWEPKIENPSEFSLSQMWILGGSFDNELNTIEAGWQVSPELYGDNRPRLFIYWTTDAYQQTGCYNLLCAGFVQTSNEVAMGAAISPSSTSRGAQYDISILIWKDPLKGDWWMEVGGVMVGYWPAKLFTHLGENTAAEAVEWGGEVAQAPALRRHSATQMGSGRFAQDGYSLASYFRNLQVVNANNQLQVISTLATSADHPACYDIRPFYNSNWGNYFYYGGPGRNPTCP